MKRVNIAADQSKRIYGHSGELKGHDKANLFMASSKAVVANGLATTSDTTSNMKSDHPWLGVPSNLRRMRRADFANISSLPTAIRK